MIVVLGHVSSRDPEVGSHDFFYPTLLGDYDALLVLMLLPRLIFKAELVIDQLKQQVRILYIRLLCTRDNESGSLG